MTKEEYVTTTKATQMLGISPYKMAKLLKEGTLKWYPDPLNELRKLIRKSDVEALLKSRPNVVKDEEGRPALAFA